MSDSGELTHLSHKSDQITNFSIFVSKLWFTKRKVSAGIKGFPLKVSGCSLATWHCVWEPWQLNKPEALQSTQIPVNHIPPLTAIRKKLSWVIQLFFIKQIGRRRIYSILHHLFWYELLKLTQLYGYMYILLSPFRLGEKMMYELCCRWAQKTDLRDKQLSNCKSPNNYHAMPVLFQDRQLPHV